VSGEQAPRAAFGKDLFVVWVSKLNGQSRVRMARSTDGGRTFAAAVLLIALCLAQQEPVTPSFHTQTDLVTVPFQVRRGSRSASDLKPSDVVLLEDGVPRSFTIFEAPPLNLTLDLVAFRF